MEVAVEVNLKVKRYHISKARSVCLSFASFLMIYGCPTISALWFLFNLDRDEFVPPVTPSASVKVVPAVEISPETLIFCVLITKAVEIW